MSFLSWIAASLLLQGVSSGGEVGIKIVPELRLMDERIAKNERVIRLWLPSVLVLFTVILLESLL